MTIHNENIRDFSALLEEKVESYNEACINYRNYEAFLRQKMSEGSNLEEVINISMTIEAVESIYDKLVDVVFQMKFSLLGHIVEGCDKEKTSVFISSMLTTIINELNHVYSFKIFLKALDSLDKDVAVNQKLIFNKKINWIIKTMGEMLEELGLKGAKAFLKSVLLFSDRKKAVKRKNFSTFFQAPYYKPTETALYLDFFKKSNLTQKLSKQTTINTKSQELAEKISKQRKMALDLISELDGDSLKILGEMGLEGYLS
ncbi:unnamed protein product, partial [marine sediment metagenome]